MAKIAVSDLAPLHSLVQLDVTEQSLAVGGFGFTFEFGLVNVKQDYFKTVDIAIGIKGDGNNIMTPAIGGPTVVPFAQPA